MNAEVPYLDDEARAAALEKALAARRRRAEIKKEIEEGKVDFLDLFDMDDEVVRRTKVSDLLKSIPAVGIVKAERVMREAGIAENRRIGGVGKNQRAKLEKIVQDNGWA